MMKLDLSIDRDQQEYLVSHGLFPLKIIYYSLCITILVFINICYEVGVFDVGKNDWFLFIISIGAFFQKNFRNMLNILRWILMSIKHTYKSWFISQMNCY